MSKKLGKLIKEARTNADLTQEALAKKVDDCSASDISKAERGEKDLTDAQLKQIAKACGVTQKSLLEADSSSSKSSSTKKSSAKSSSGKSSSSGTSVKVTSTEKKLLEYYRAADSDTKKAALAVLKGEASIDKGLLNTILTSAASTVTDSDSVLGDILGGLLNNK